MGGVVKKILGAPKSIPFVKGTKKAKTISQIKAEKVKEAKRLKRARLLKQAAGIGTGIAFAVYPDPRNKKQSVAKTDKPTSKKSSSTKIASTKKKN